MSIKRAIFNFVEVIKICEQKKPTIKSYILGK